MDQVTKRFGPLNHFDYALIDSQCSCGICESWRETDRKFQEARRRFEEHGACGCGCKKDMYQTRSAYLISMNRRDLYCESSFHAAHDPSLGRPYMEWISHEISNQHVRTSGWWVYQSQDYCLLAWFGKFRRAVTAAVAASGLGTAPPLSAI